MKDVKNVGMAAHAVVPASWIRGCGLQGKDRLFLPGSLKPAEATDMRLVVVDFPTAEADIVLLCWNRWTLAVRRMYGPRSRGQLVVWNRDYWIRVVASII